MSVDHDPITGLSIVDESSQETQSSVSLRPQSPLVRGSHLDKSVERIKKRPNLTSQLDNDLLQLPAKRGELLGRIPPVYGVVNLKEKIDHIVTTIATVIDGEEQFITEEELLLAQPPNLEKTRFTMGKKKLKLQFIDDILDRFEDERWLFPDRFARRRKLWHKSASRSLKFIGKFLDKELSNSNYARPQNPEESVGNATIGSESTQTSTQKTGRGRAKTRAAIDTSTIPKKRVRKTKETTIQDGLATVSQLTLPAPSKKIPKKSTTKDVNIVTSSPIETTLNKPTFARKKKEVKTTDANETSAVEKKKKRGREKAPETIDGEASPPKRRRKEQKDLVIKTKEASAAPKKKNALGGQKGKKGVVKAGTEEEPSTELCAGSSMNSVDMDKKASEKVQVNKYSMVENHLEKSGVIETDKKNELEKRLKVYDEIDEDEKPVHMGNKASSTGTSINPTSSRDDGMETDDDEWEPDVTPREMTPPRALLSTSQDAHLRPSTSSSFMSHSSQSLFGSLSSSLIGSPNSSFSSQSSLSLLAPSITTSFNLSSSLIPSQPLATSTQIPTSQSPLMKKKKSDKKEKESTSSAPKVKPQFGTKKK